MGWRSDMSLEISSLFRMVDMCEAMEFCVHLLRLFYIYFRGRVPGQTELARGGGHQTLEDLATLTVNDDT